jgi:hypothetical protein
LFSLNTAEYPNVFRQFADDVDNSFFITVYLFFSVFRRILILSEFKGVVIGAGVIS